MMILKDIVNILLKNIVNINLSRQDIISCLLFFIKNKL